MRRFKACVEEFVKECVKGCVKGFVKGCVKGVKPKKSPRNLRVLSCGAEPRRTAARPPLTLTASRALIDRLPHVNNATTARHVFSPTISRCAGQPWPFMHALLFGDEGRTSSRAGLVDNYVRECLRHVSRMQSGSSCDPAAPDKHTKTSGQTSPTLMLLPLLRTLLLPLCCADSTPAAA